MGEIEDRRREMRTCMAQIWIGFKGIEGRRGTTTRNRSVVEDSWIIMAEEQRLKFRQRCRASAICAICAR